ncbi:Nudix hydrolase 3 [Operophtera brumata]|uniref:Nudix hydrolase 3 n=1 Tax=Operophtera brumata TaxID=104452 RepID=A0A0L7KNG4_OPEBR|nr:Nudix hydrolase 3 [Operophtera brumata]
MSLRPAILLSSAAKARCLSNIKELPSFMEKNTAEKTLSSVLVPLCIVNEEVCLLYTLRSSNLVRHSGQVSFPGGKRDNNETVIETALRETEEEIGFPREQIDVWGMMSELQGRDRKMIITPVVGQLKNYDFINIVPNSDEVEEVFTVSMQTLCDANNHAHLMFKSIPLPIFMCGKHKVWGITGLITHLFLLSFLPSDVYNPNFMIKEYEIDELLPSKL